MSQKLGKEATKVFSKTINSPKTPFPMFASPSQREKPFLKKCTSNLYAWQLRARASQSNKVWITHDGPPYANGDLHMGHFENKVLKDIINRHKVLSGYRVEYKPGWDCHGLPIELKALQSIASNDKVVDPIEIRRLSRKFASDTIKKQKKTINQWGIMCDISIFCCLEDKDKNGCYYTFTKEYELSEIRLFGEMVDKHCIYRGLKPVYWSPQSHTALAEAELEYNGNHKSQSIYVTFSIQNSTNDALAELMEESPINALVYTTTPWTIPSNLCLCVNPDSEYAVVENAHHQRYLIMKDRLEEVTKLKNEEFTVILDSIPGLSLQGSTYKHPLFNTPHVMISGYHVTNDTGTGIVHTAPSHGLDDFHICVYHQVVNLPGMSPSPSTPIPRVTLPSSVPRYTLKEDVDENGCYLPTAWTSRLQGKSVLSEGNQEVISMLKESNHLYFHKEITHRYPYDWRAKTPVIFRLTPQWFIDTKQITKNGEILNQLKNTTMIPSSSYSRLSAMIRDRPDWCISRQRSWGVPIPIVFGITESGEEVPLMSKQNIAYIEEVLKEKGVDYWFGEAEDTEFVHPDLLKESKFVKWSRCHDTLDVWVDSGLSWFVNYPNQVVDLYLEGSDQHRGWFQSSIYTSYVQRKTLPFKNLITHGFLVDENGQKMSKSLGNLITPGQLFGNGEGMKQGKQSQQKKKPEVPKSLFDKEWPVDVGRLWVASSDYTYDVSLGLKQLLKVQESYQKIRNTNRYLLSNLYDFDATKDCIRYSDLSFPDKWCLSRLYSVSKSILNAYDHFAFTEVYRSLVGFTISDLSATYFDIVKDRLYTDSPSSVKRRSTQTVLHELLKALPRLVAPITPFLAEEIFSYSQKDAKKSVFEDGYSQLHEEWNNSSITETWNVISEIKTNVNRELETFKKQGVIKSGLEVDLSLQFQNESLRNRITSIDKDDLADSFICSNVYDSQLHGDMLYEGEIVIPEWEDSHCVLQIQKSQNERCPRCWKYKPLIPLSETLPPVCERCHSCLEGKM